MMMTSPWTSESALCGPKGSDYESTKEQPNNVGDNTRSPCSTMVKMRSKREATEQENEAIRHRVLRRVGAASRRKTSKFSKQRLPNQQEAKRFQCLFRRPSNTYKYALFPNAVDSDLALYYLIMYVVFFVLSVLSLFDMYSPLVTSNSISTLFSFLCNNFE